MRRMTALALRLGAASVIPVAERVSVAAEVKVDLVHGEPTIVFGMTIGYEF